MRVSCRDARGVHVTPCDVWACMRTAALCTLGAAGGDGGALVLGQHVHPLHTALARHPATRPCDITAQRSSSHAAGYTGVLRRHRSIRMRVRGRRYGRDLHLLAHLSASTLPSSSNSLKSRRAAARIQQQLTDAAERAILLPPDNGQGRVRRAEAYVRVTMRGSAVPCEESALPPSSGGIPHCSAPLLLRRNCRGDAAAACSDSTLRPDRDDSSCAAYSRAQPHPNCPFTRPCTCQVLALDGTEGGSRAISKTAVGCDGR